MLLKLMFITNNPMIAKYAEEAGVNRIFVDMEHIGKEKRQGGLDTVQNRHTLEDIKKISEVITEAELLVRINPIHDRSYEYTSSKEEIDNAIANGAKILMLPYFKTVSEVEKFIKLVDGRVKTIPLLETPEAVAVIDDILKIDGIDEMYIGLNDLSLGYGKKFMFELLSDGTVERLSNKFLDKNIPYGFGGIAGIGKGLLPAEKILLEHYRLHSSSVILSRAFCDTQKISNIADISNVFQKGVRDIREYEKNIERYRERLIENKKEINEIVQTIIAS